MKIYYHIHGVSMPLVLEASPEEKVIALLKKSTPPGDHSFDSLHISLENSEDSISPEMTFIAAGIQDKDHLHASRCSHIDIAVNYGGKIEHIIVNPATTVEKTIERASHKFHIDPVAVSDLVLQTTDKVTLDDSITIGSITIYPDCKLSLILSAKVIIQG